MLLSRKKLIKSLAMGGRWVQKPSSKFIPVLWKACTIRSIWEETGVYVKNRNYRSSAGANRCFIIW